MFSTNCQQSIVSCLKGSDHSVRSRPHRRPAAGGWHVFEIHKLAFTHKERGWGPFLNLMNHQYGVIINILAKLARLLVVRADAQVLIAANDSPNSIIGLMVLSATINTVAFVIIFLYDEIRR